MSVLERRLARQHRTRTVVADSRAELVVRMLRHDKSRLRSLADFLAKKSILERFLELRRRADPSSVEPDAAFAIYAHATHSTGLLADYFLELGEFEAVKARLDHERRLYMPDGLAMSPITQSLFSSWSLFDMRDNDETLGLIVEAAVRELAEASELADVISKLNGSRLGFFVQETHQGELFRLRELATNQSGKFVIQSGYTGQAGDLLLVRTAPPPLPDVRHGAVLTTPYLILQPGLGDWKTYFDRALVAPRRKSNYEKLMKHGLLPQADRYWLEYALEAYVNHSQATILLAGFPDLDQAPPSHAPEAFSAEPGSA